MARTRNVLVVEDQKRERDALTRVLALEGYTSVAISGPKELSERIAAEIDLAIVDLRLGMDSGIDVLASIKTLRPSVPVIMVTAYGAIETAVAAMKMGAVDYLTKPLKPQELLAKLDRYLPQESVGSDESSWPVSAATLRNQLGSSPELQRILNRSVDLSASSLPVLILGEQGTGHELVASFIHDSSPRSSGPFVDLCVPAFSSSAIEKELFGSGRTDYYSRTKENKGRLTRASGGTLFIEDYFLLNREAQVTLSQLTDSTSLLSRSSGYYDVRLIASANHNLFEMNETPSQASELLSPFGDRIIELPALRNHPQDIPSLIEHLLTTGARRHLRSRPQLDESLLTFMYEYEWPGNVRQLQNAIENILVLSRNDTITMNELTSFLGGEQLGDNQLIAVTDLSLMDLERLAIIGALKRSLGNKTHAAQKLGISLRTLQRKLKQWKLEGADHES